MVISTSSAAFTDQDIFLTSLIEPAEQIGPRSAVNRVFMHLADLLDEDKFKDVDFLLRNVPVRNLPPSVGLAFLMGTANLTPLEVPFRQEFRQRLRDWYVASGDEHSAHLNVDTIQ